MGGNVSRSGITADLESMRRVGLGGVTLFNLSCDGTPPGPVGFASPEWFDLVRFAAEECVRLGLDFRLANCAGWTCSGGPWVPVEDSMKEFVFSETNFVGVLDAPEPSSALCPLPCPQPPAKDGFYRDIATIAFPVPASYRKRPLSNGEEKCCRVFSWSSLSRDRGKAALDEVIDPSLIRVLRTSPSIDPSTLQPFTLQQSISSTLTTSRWYIVRCGYTTTAKRNFPCRNGGSGYEVDKFSAEAVSRHFRAHVKKVADSLGAGRAALKGIVIDSYEVGPCSWTDGVERLYAQRRGRPGDVPSLFAALTGHVVGSVAETEALLADYRRLLADLFARNYAGTMRRLANAEGLTLALEPYISPFDDLQYSRYCDIPMGEIWPSQKDMLSCPGGWELPASAAHFWGGRLVDAEAFTQNPLSGTSARWLWDPLAIKACGDVAFARGMNRFCINSFAHQPWTVAGPGMTMGFWGIRYDRTEPWWACTRPFNRYLARCQYLLQEGRIARDVLLYGGEGVPNRFSSPGFPNLSFDIVGGEGLQAVRVENGLLVSPAGTRYRALVLQPCEWNGTNVAVRIDELRRQGVKFGVAGIEPDVVASEKGFAWIHRTYEDGTEGYFVSWPNTNKAVTASVSFRQQGRAPELWNPETGAMHVPSEWRAIGKRTEIVLSLERSGSVFVMFPVRPTPGAKHPEKPATLHPWNPEWRVAFDSRTFVPSTHLAPSTTHLFDWSKCERDEIRYFSGTATYRTSLADFGGGVIDFGEVRDFAEVFVDGQPVATLWKPPYRCEVPRGKVLEVRVTNGWPNRMIGDERRFAPDAQMNGRCGWMPVHGFGMSGPVPAWVREGKASPTGRSSFATWQHWLKDDPLQPSGLLGPVMRVPNLNPQPSTLK